MANTPNYAGMFLRGYGSQNHTKNNGSAIGNTTTNHASGALGSIQGDSIREISGSFGQDGCKTSIRGTNRYGGLTWGGDGSFYHTENWFQGSVALYNPDYVGNVQTRKTNFNSSRIVPTTNEVRSVNIAVRYLIRCR